MNVGHIVTGHLNEVLNLKHDMNYKELAKKARYFKEETRDM